MKNYEKYLIPFFLLLAFVIDGQLSTLFINLTPGIIHVSSHLLLIVGLFSVLYIPTFYNLIMFTIAGFLYDIYYLNILGIFVTLFPLVVYLIDYFYQSLKFKRVTNQIILLVVVFMLEFGAFLFARLFELSNLSMFIFVVYSLVPTLIFNSLSLLILQPLLEKFFYITNKT
ncbi:rod shape-determining protein MreD [Streptococcus azizii]|uniref:Rod shape-determining protein MreD n=1 Tax=Streptococcus azizii TaxID=1579424 RepID=A0AB36JQD0_9STRE|nr:MULTISPECIES: rod shape-determining protein MreD [Streptococcus]MBF0776635.1 rod shape-determining protein MreD [Streptococcus sp. 19428wD3_AN2]ONK25904.1 rod shape-determining protein MreD [Streptococcus azizii]ONK26290.1 rod shape-determining protein MreD [Streptococcus azizii]ONK27018.1 rod shape-determining protein MreD [Streptococcus azizii]TFU82586.1 rod shape-determining protein MreD [Streptococcus sp. AN2]